MCSNDRMPFGICATCSNAELRGFPPKGSPEWEVGTVYCWCPLKKQHETHEPTCDLYEKGDPKRLDEFGLEL